MKGQPEGAMDCFPCALSTTRQSARAGRSRNLVAHTFAVCRLRAIIDAIPWARLLNVL